MRNNRKWIRLLVLTAFLVSTMPFASHAMMLHPLAKTTMQTEDISAPSDCATHHKKTDDPQQQDCECMTTGCYNTALLSPAINLISEYTTGILFSTINNHTHSAYVKRLERPPRL